MRFATRRCNTRGRQGFTIWEILVVIVVISVGLLSVVVVLTNGLKYVQKTRYKVVALNLAREGMEAIYQLRDTNRTKRAGVKDQCWLKINPLVDEWALRCPDDLWFVSGSYALEHLSVWWQQYFALTWPRGVLDVGNGLDSGDLQYSLCQTWGFRYPCIWLYPTSSEWIYFREIQWLGLYLKDESITWWLALWCTWWMSPGCWTNRAKEFRFCSRVVYIGDTTGEVKLCWVLTNFKGK